MSGGRGSGVPVRLTVGGRSIDEFEKFGVVVEHGVERGGAVVMNIRRCFSNSSRAGNVERLPIVFAGSSQKDAAEEGYVRDRSFRDEFSFRWVR
jgi:hypothetical protein